MNAAGEGRLKGFWGPVSRLIEVGAKLGVAIETALGANVQNIVTEDEEAAKAAINLLKTKNAGRATFYPITTVKGGPLNIDERDMSAYKGYVGIASALVKYDRKYAQVVEYLLGRTVVFDNLDDASVMARAFGYRVRIVTLDGQLINAGGSFTGGSVRRESGMLTRSAEISRIEAEITKLNVGLSAKQTELDEISERQKELDGERNSEKKTVSLITSLYSAEKTQLEVMKSQRDGEVERVKTLGGEYERLASKLEGYEAERAKAASELETGEKRADELDSETEKLDGGLKDPQTSKIARLRDSTLLVTLTRSARIWTPPKKPATSTRRS